MRTDMSIGTSQNSSIVGCEWASVLAPLPGVSKKDLKDAGCSAQDFKDFGIVHCPWTVSGCYLLFIRKLMVR